MMKKWTALLMALVLSLSLLPTAALADDTPATGVYFAQQNGVPSGDCKDATEKSGFGDGEKTLTGYWEIPYTAGTALTVYYYNAEMTQLTGRENQHITTAQVDKDGHFWSITLSNDVSSEEAWADLNYQTANGDGNFVMTFKKQTAAPSTPSAPTTPREAGLYYKALRESRSNGELTIEEVGDYEKLERIQVAPYVDRVALALYYFDGEATEPTPVTRVRLPRKYGVFHDCRPDDVPAFDLVAVGDQVNGAFVKDNWFYLSAFDFSYGVLEYFKNPRDERPAGAVLLDSHQLPGVAFYADDTTALTAQNAVHAEKVYRMYTVMQRMPAGSAYRYTTSLYLRSTDADFTFDEVDDLTYE